MSKQNYRAYLAWAATCIIWGTTYLAIKIGVADLPPLLFAGFRWIIAGPIFLLIISHKKYALPKKGEIIPLAVIGISLIGVANGAVVVAEQWIPSGLTSLLISTLPFWVIGLETIFPPKIKLNMKIVIGLVVGFAGVSLIFLSDLKLLFDPEYLFGVLLILGGVISWSAGSLYSKHRKISAHPLVSAAFQMFFAGAAQTILGLSLGELDRFSFTTESLLAFIYLLFFGSMLGFTSYIYAIAHLRVSFVTTYAYINPIIALFLGWLVLGERLDLIIIFSAALILIGVAIVNYSTLISKTK